ncbi:unnamed protein product [Absidia cylindrospora]
MKLDLRILCTASNNAFQQDDVSGGEFAKGSTCWKYYKDKTKLVMHGKLLLNEVVNNLGHDDNTRICMLQAMGLEAELYSLRPLTNGHGIIKIPKSAGLMKSLLEKLSLLKQLSLKAKDYYDRLRIKNDSQKTGMARLTADDEEAPSKVKWTRDVWYTPALSRSAGVDDASE